MDQPVQDTPGVVQEDTDQLVQDSLGETESISGPDISDPCPVEYQGGVSLDDFDSDGFIDALRRDRFFGEVSLDGINVSDGDWLLPLDSDTEGDGESILQDVNDDADDDANAADLGVTVTAIVELNDDVPVELDLTGDDLENLQSERWDVYMEDQSNRFLHDVSPLYDGPSGPTRAALAYAENPLATFYFFLPKEIWRKIADETNTYRRDSVDEVAQQI
ncbi:Hypothetical protein PHPALM_6331 [Phytophthora palmivora]|uniref:Uncharacterized protein n=1 Tax=Phytophthora palmivora TaxID=4796 RepID=A0A2P4YFG2_9STRA|nr:Hypothetical protein PHPALM_6331 [Phytophthora palmivora]